MVYDALFRAELTYAVALAVAHDSFPDESDLFTLVWERLRDGIADAGTSGLTSLPMFGDQSDELSIPFLIMTVAAVLDALPDGIEPPNSKTVESAVRVAAQSLGVRGPQLNEIVGGAAPKLFKAFSMLCGSAPPADQKAEPASKTHVWVEWWLDCRLVNPEPVIVPYDSVVKDEQTLRADLIIDERRGMLTGAGIACSLGDFEWKGLLGAWLALDSTGRHFTYGDIKKRRRDPHWPIDDRGLQKYVNETRVILKKLIGGNVIPRPHMKRYYIVADAWSWCWIRDHKDRERSILLATSSDPPNG